MDNELAYREYLVNANNTANFYNTVLWLLFIIIVLAPLLWLIAVIIYTFATTRKCPDCGSSNNVSGHRVSYEGDKKTGISVPVKICLNCDKGFE